MDFTSTLILAQRDDLGAKEAIVHMCNPLIMKRSMILNQYDEDLYQNLMQVFLKCIDRFRMK